MKEKNSLAWHSLSSSEYAQAIALYAQAFPAEERRDSKEWIALYEQRSGFNIYALTQSGNFVGILGFWTFSRFVYIEHFATLSSLRGRGVGSSLLRRFIAQCSPHPLVLEVEPAQNEITQRRIAFYERQGFMLSPCTYVQPPYREDGTSIPLCLMCTNGDFLSMNYNEVVRTLHEKVYGVSFH